MMASEHGTAESPLPAAAERQRKQALIAIATAERELASGNIDAARTELLVVAVHLLAMAPEDMTATAPGTEDRTEEPTR